MGQTVQQRDRQSFITGCQLPDFLLIQCGNLAEVKAVQLFNNRYLGFLEPLLPAASISLQDLLLGQSEEEASVALVALSGFSGVSFMMAAKAQASQPNRNRGDGGQRTG